jgi:nucleoside-diphosphate-sugar epimerase
MKKERFLNNPKLTTVLSLETITSKLAIYSIEMRILITGSNGFIGRYLCNRLKNHHHLIGVGTKKDSLHNDIEYYSMSIEEDSFPHYIKSKINSCDIVIHLAAQITKSNTDKMLIDINCNGSLNVLLAAIELGAKKIIYASSVPVIGIPRILPITEIHPALPTSLYHITKLMPEHIFSLAEKYDIKSINLRISSPIGIGMRENTILPTFIKSCISNKPIVIFGNGSRYQNFIDVRDIAEAFKKAIDNDVSGTFNVVSDKGISNLDLAMKCLKITNSNSEIIIQNEFDPEDSHIWEVSSLKSKKYLSFSPIYSLEESIYELFRHYSSL